MPAHTHRRPKGLFVGLATVDLTYPVEAIPRRNQKISVPGQHIAAGGPATNAAITFGFLGGAPILVSAVGRHPLAAVIRHDLARSSVTLHDLARRRTEAPPISSILVTRDTGERAVISANAAIFSPRAADFDPAWLTGVSIVQVDGHYMPLCLKVARLAHARGIPVVLDSGSWKPGMAGLLRFTDIVICSEDFRPPGCSNRKQVFDFLAAKGIRQVAITRGAKPIEFLERGTRGKVAVKSIRPVDTLGAGDIFHGAFCYYASRGDLSFHEALAAAGHVAAFSCRYLGTRAWMNAFPGP
jgi:sugar/nucleoside kinase (ribokinase family)